LLKVLAGCVKSYRSEPANLTAWMNNHENERILDQSSVLKILERLVSFALPMLSDSERTLLNLFASLRRPTPYDLLTSIVVGETTGVYKTIRIFSNYSDADKALSVIEELGLIGWDQQSNLYDMHPVIRESLSRTLPTAGRDRLELELALFFAIQQFSETLTPTELHDMTPTLELFFRLDRLALYGEAWKLFRTRLFQRLMKLGAIDELLSVVTRLLVRHDQGDFQHLSEYDEGFLLNSALQVFVLKADFATAEILARRLAIHGLKHRLTVQYIEGLSSSALVMFIRGDFALAKALAESGFRLALASAQGAQAGWCAVTLGILAGLRNATGEATGYTRYGISLLARFGRTSYERNMGHIIGALSGNTPINNGQRPGTILGNRAPRQLSLSGYAYSSRNAGPLDFIEHVVRLMMSTAAYMENQQLSNAMSDAEQLVELSRVSGSTLFEAIGQMLCGRILVATDQYAEAKRRFHIYLSLIDSSENQFFSLDVFDMLSEIALEEGDRKTSAEYAKQAVECALRIGPPLVDTESLESVLERLDLLGEERPQNIESLSSSRSSDKLIGSYLHGSLALPNHLLETLVE
jgi:hypothetical protein